MSLDGRGAFLAVSCFVAAFSVTARASSADAVVTSIDNVAMRAQANAVTIVEARGTVSSAEATRHGARLSRVQNPYAELWIDRGAYTKDLQVQANLWLPVELGDQRATRIEEADQFVKWKSMGLVEARARVLGEAITVYGELLVASSRLDEARRGEIDARAEAQYYAGRLAAGDATIVDKSMADAEVGRWVQSRAEAELLVNEASMRLSSLVGRGGLELPPAGTAANVPLLRHPFADAEAVALAGKSPIVNALVAEATYWDASRKRFESEVSPPVSFIATIGRGDMGEMRYGGGIAWSFPVIRKNQGEIARANAEYSRTTSVQSSARAVLEARIVSAYKTLEAARVAVEAIDRDTLPAAKRVVDASSEGFRAGKVDPVRVLIARRDYATAKTRRLDLVALAWRAYGGIAVIRGELP